MKNIPPFISTRKDNVLEEKEKLKIDKLSKKKRIKKNNKEIKVSFFK